MNTLEQVKALIGDKAGIPAADVQDDAWLGQSVDPRGPDQQFLDLDSADRLELQMEIEERFCIDISDAQAEQAEMGTPAGIAGYVDKMLTGEYAAGIIHEPGTNGTPAEDGVSRLRDWMADQVTDEVMHAIGEGLANGGIEFITPGESDADITEANSREYERGFTAGYAAARPLDPGVIHIGESAPPMMERKQVAEVALDAAGGIELCLAHMMPGKQRGVLYQRQAAPLQYREFWVVREGDPITREELMQRGLAEDLGGAVMDIVMKLGFPTEGNPMGTEATHELVPVAGVLPVEVATDAHERQWVKFLRIERVEPFDQIHFDHPAADTPDWLMEACSLPSGDEGAIWADNGVLFVATPRGHEPVKPGQLIRVVPQLQVADDVLVDPEFLKAD